MKLLNQSKVESEKKSGLEKQVNRVKKLNQAELEAVMRTNLALNQHKEKMSLIEEELETARQESKQVIDGLKNEIQVLEIRRKQAMKPVKELREQAQGELRQAEEKSEQVRQDAELIQTMFEEVMEAMLDLSMEKESLKEKEEHLKRREQILEAAEANMAESAKTIADKWAELHKATHRFNSLSKEEWKTVKQEKAEIKALAAQVEETSKKQKQERRAIKDAYIALEEAKRHVYGSKKGRK